MSGAREPIVKTGDVIDGRYRILKTLGEGGMGTVFLAEHTLIKRRVALKLLHPELATDAEVVERFMNEARAAGTLGHPNIVESTDMGFTPERVPYIVFEFLEGALLTDEIYRVGGFTVRRAVRIAQQIASALHAAHVANIIHRDLKSDNVFLTDKDESLDHVKVLDFGISRFLEIEDEKTRRGIVMGTPEFMSPEQITAPDQVDRRTDVYALGVILYEMLTARRPFSSEEDPRALLTRIVNTPAPPLGREDVPHALGELIPEQDARQGSGGSLPDDDRRRGGAVVVHHARRGGWAAPRPADHDVAFDRWHRGADRRRAEQRGAPSDAAAAVEHHRAAVAPGSARYRRSHHVGGGAARGPQAAVAVVQRRGLGLAGRCSGARDRHARW